MKTPYQTLQLNTIQNGGARATTAEPWACVCHGFNPPKLTGGSENLNATFSMGYETVKLAAKNGQSSLLRRSKKGVF